MSAIRSHQTPDVEPWDVKITPQMVRKVSIVCFIAWVVSVYDFTLFGTLLPVIAEDFGWTTAEATAVNTVAHVGIFVVALAVGTIIDRMGRKNALVVLMLGGAAAAGFTGLAAGAVSLILIRSFSGFSMSEEVVNAVYLNEMYKEAKNRGLMYSLVQGGWPVGALVSAGMSALLLPIIGWRWSFVVAAVMALFVALLASRLPESPTFAAIREVQRRRAAGDVEGAHRLAAEHDLEEGSHHRTGFKDVFTPELRKHTTLLALAWFFNWFAIQVFSVLGTTVLVEAKGVTFENALIVLVLANAVGFIGYVFHGWLGDRITRKRTVVIGWLAGAIVSLAMLLGPGTPWFVFPMYALTLFFLTGPYAALLFYMGESFPAHVRGMGTNVAHVMAPLGGIAGSGVLSLLLFLDVDMQWAAIVSGTGGLLVSALCMAGTRTIDDAGKRTTVIA